MLEHPPGVDDGEELAPGLEPEEQPAKAAMTATAGTAVSQAHAAAPPSHVAGSHAQDAVYTQRMPPGYQDYFSDYYSAYAAYGPDGCSPQASVALSAVAEVLPTAPAATDHVSEFQQR
ncbi:hypothetical protein HaLaN_09990 [Haematococcus lacustris]|uniref:Uncharacterized protein n=1 Tax=Haematococcus lacustris TaxID=44745 RepID=A0A699YUU7_HAELA|nr:hypothetical protein HaLaN_09990 [Haematococcus lacustris]